MLSGYRILRLTLTISLFSTLTTVGAAQPVVETLGDAFQGSGGVSLHPSGEALYIGNFGDCFGGNPTCWGRDVKRMTLADEEVETFATGFFVASGNDFEADGDTLLQAELGRGYLWKVAPDGTTRRWATGFASPVGVVATPDGLAYVAECGGNVVSLVHVDGVREVFAESDEFNCPNGITRAPDGTLYTVNFQDGKILEIDTNGDVSVLAVGPGGGNGHVRYSAGRLIVADRSGNQILGVSLDGEIEVIAGSGEEGNADGATSEATFIRPNGVAVSPDGTTIYVSSKVSEDPNEINPVLIRKISGVTVSSEAEAEQEEQGLLPAAPNPSRGGTTIRYTLEQASPVELAVYNLLGQRVVVLDDAVRESGPHAVTWDGTDGAGRAVASGTYLYSLRTERGEVETRLMTLLR